jgi:hypothetical protein
VIRTVSIAYFDDCQEQTILWFMCLAVIKDLLAGSAIDAQYLAKE